MIKNQSGQSTIEFIFSFVFAVSLILMVFKTALNYASGYVAHYATFMASRVFLTQDSNDNTFSAGDRGGAFTKAEAAFNSYKLSYFGIKSELKVNDEQNVSAGEYLMIGAYAKFSQKIDIVGRVTGQTQLELISESFLGREFTRGVCASRICHAIKDEDTCSLGYDVTLYDDGC